MSKREILKSTESSPLIMKRHSQIAFRTPKMSSRNGVFLVPNTPQMTEKRNISLVKDLCCIAKLRQQKSQNLKDAVRSLREKYGSLRSISARLGLTWGEFQNIYYYRKIVKADYSRKIDEQTKK